MANKTILNNKHGVGVMFDENGKMENLYPDDSTDKVVIQEVDKVTGQMTRTWHSGIDPLQDIVIGVASKKRFMEWWHKHTDHYPIRNDKGVVDSGKVIRMNKDGIDVIDTQFIVHDNQITEFPFRLNNVDLFTIEAPELHSLKNCPVVCRIGTFGTRSHRMRYLDSMVDCPRAANILSFYTESTMLNLQHSVVTNLQSLTIDAPEFASFEGLNPDVGIINLTLFGHKQQSFKGIHKGVKSNVSNLTINVNQDFPGGVLPFAMLEPGIGIIPDVSGNPPRDFISAMEVVIQGRKDGKNVHDIQEQLIDGGLGKYARL